MTFHPNIEKSFEQLLVVRIQELSSPLTPKPAGISEHLSPLSDIRAVLFDVYGTLFISGAGDISIASEMSYQQACAEALRAAGFSGNLEQAGIQGSERLIQAIRETHVIQKQKGVPYPEVDIRKEWQTVLLALQRSNLLEGEITPDSIACVGLEYECRVNPVWPMPKSLLTLQELREKRFELGIVSNAQFYTPLMFPALLGKSHVELGFDPHLCAWSYQVREVKPSTKMFQGIVAHLNQACGLAPDETLYVGNDMLNDVWTASQCGLKTALFAGDQRSLRLREADPRCAELEPDVVITKFSQLLECLS